ncbi:hypothetical protein LIER_04602 [Lithospermum erythrorhizon]|uniref:PHD-type zinc finger plants domain-containing protein n=1 Tax=Lithospermum erythrorhizon TaxID=34254 RepID=A0AAV3P021_LITER
MWRTTHLVWLYLDPISYIKYIGKVRCKMRSDKEEIGTEISEKETHSHECCMCGDYGLTFELFRCKVCKNKSQHRYCSNEYPKADSYEICNWCLSQKNNSVDKAQNSNSSSFSHKMERGQIMIKVGRGNDHRRQISPKGEKNKGSSLKLKLINNNNKPIKKTKSLSPQGSPPRSPAARKRIVVGGSLTEEKLRRTRSENTLQRSNSTIIRKHVFKNKMRRYKLLAEVSC